MLESNLEALVDNLLSAYGIGLPQSQLRRFGKSPFRPDFLARGTHDSRIAIEVRQADVDARTLYVLYVWHDEARTRKAIDQLLLVTPEPPSDEDMQRFEKVFDGDKTAQWIGITQLPGALGITDDIDFESPEARDRLQTASLIRKTRVYRNDVIGVANVVADPKVADGELSALLRLPRSLARQFSIKSLTTIGRSGQPPEKALRIGQECRCYVLLSDIKSFSTLVRVGDAQLIQEMMGSYYRRAREIIWTHGGVLDKFIGDAVLAIWGYPEEAEHDAGDTVRAAAELITLGRSLLDEFQSRQNEAIESGTRVGIANDAVLVLNIGTDEAEISFVGNAINLAARLETACSVDGVLMDNRTRASLLAFDDELHRLAAAQETLLDDRQVKGQLTTIRAWQITKEGIGRILQTGPVSAS